MRNVTGSSKAWRWVSRSAVAGWVVFAACKQVPTVGIAAADRPECPQDSVRVTLVDTVDDRPQSRTFTSISVAGPISHVPEFHDCQRLMTGAGTSYGPLAAVFASSALDSLYSGREGTTLELARSAAEILSYDGDYRPLHIQTGFSCLYLWQPTPGQWRARIQWVGLIEQDCLQAPDPRHPSWPLEVAPVASTLRGEDIPPVARWDWDPVRHQHYIGIRCGEQWCEVGAPGFSKSATRNPTSSPQPKPVPNRPAPSARERRRVVEVKGWYDEQRLAVPAAAGLDASDIIGTATPHPLLGTLNAVADFDGNWMPVGTITLDRSSADYKSKLNLDHGVNNIYLCSGSARRCIPETAPVPSCSREADGQWWAMIESATQDTTYRCVTRRTHPGLNPPATLRWRWLVDDETTWIRCPEGCCTID